MTSLAYIIHNAKSPSQRLFLCVKSSFVNQFSKFLQHFLRLLEYKRMTRSYLIKSVSVLEHGKTQNRQFPNDVVRRVP